jgi:FKBP-type peptidyl-prolyl cis-trans isomerase
VQSQIDAAVPNGVATDSGLRYVITKQGRGRRKPSATSTVTVHYVGKLLNGTVFDSSLARNEPGVFPTNRVIPGFSETLQDMRVGEKRTVLIPPELGYGSRGAANGAIPGGAHLIFEIELISFQ